MASRALDTEIDRLYQLPPDQFTSARNALAKEAGSDAARVRALSKPPIAAWAVNQLYWHDRQSWDSLIEAATTARRVHKAVLSGRGGDLRSASKAHDDAVETGLKRTLALLRAAGHPATDTTRQAILTTLRALPGDEAPGRLTETLQPGGFEALAGLSVGSVTQARRTPKPAARRSTAPSGPAPQEHADAQALMDARDAARAAALELREAEQAVKREEFETARLAREEERAADAAKGAREALKRATSELERAEADLAAAERERKAARARATAVQQRLSSARRDATATAAEAEKLEAHGRTRNKR